MTPTLDVSTLSPAALRRWVILWATDRRTVLTERQETLLPARMRDPTWYPRPCLNWLPPATLQAWFEGLTEKEQAFVADLITLATKETIVE